MSYKSKGKRDCTQSDGTKGKYQTVKKDGTKRCYKSKKQYTAAMAWAHESDETGETGEDLMVSEKMLRSMIKEELKRAYYKAKKIHEAPEGEDVSSAELQRAFKDEASVFASDMPAKFNDELMNAMNALKAMAEFDPSMFQKTVGLTLQYGAKALEKEKLGSKAEKE